MLGALPALFRGILNCETLIAFARRHAQFIFFRCVSPLSYSSAETVLLWKACALFYCAKENYRAMCHTKKSFYEKERICRFKVFIADFSFTTNLLLCLSRLNKFWYVIPGNRLDSYFLHCASFHDFRFPLNSLGKKRTWSTALYTFLTFFFVTNVHAGKIFESLDKILRQCFKGRAWTAMHFKDRAWTRFFNI